MSEKKKDRKTEKFGDKIEDLTEFFPALMREIQESEQRFIDEEMRTSHGTKKFRKFAGYEPGVIDFICRCRTVDEALEIIEFMLKRKEITEEYADELKRQLVERGLESFGPHRTAGYYERA